VSAHKTIMAILQAEGVDTSDPLVSLAVALLVKQYTTGNAAGGTLAPLVNPAGMLIADLGQLSRGKPSKRKPSAYSKKYGKAFKKVATQFKKKSGGWKKNGFKNAQKAAHKVAKKMK
jgi:hypothetical protein